MSPTGIMNFIIINLYSSGIIPPVKNIHKHPMYPIQDIGLYPMFLKALKNSYVAINASVATTAVSNIGLFTSSTRSTYTALCLIVVAITP